MSRLLEAYKDYDEARTKISELCIKKDNAKKVFEEVLKGGMFKHHVKDLINRKLYENMTNYEKEQLDKERKERERKVPSGVNTWASIDSDGNYAYGSATSYTYSNVFDPELDEYEITYISFDQDKIKIEVDCIRLRQYLGITGAWIPSYHFTDWFDIAELSKAEEEDM